MNKQNYQVIIIVLIGVVVAQTLTLISSRSNAKLSSEDLASLKKQVAKEMPGFKDRSHSGPEGVKYINDLIERGQIELFSNGSKVESLSGKHHVDLGGKQTYRIEMVLPSIANNGSSPISTSSIGKGDIPMVWFHFNKEGEMVEASEGHRLAASKKE